MIVVMGATGNTGKKIVVGLLGKGVPVRAIGRSRGRLAELAALGAELAVGDSRDAGFLARAFAGADAAYTLLPTDRRAADYRGMQDHEGEAIVSALREAGVPRVVALTSVGAELAEGSGLIAGFRAQEERLRSLPGVHRYLLHAVSFFEDFHDQLEVILHEGVVADSVDANLAIPMVASRDVAAAAIEALTDLTWTGEVVRELIGERDLSYTEAALILGERIGRPGLPYVRLADDEMVVALTGSGLSASFAERYVAMTRAFNACTVRPRHGRTRENTTPTSFETFADELASTWAALVST